MQTKRLFIGTHIDKEIFEYYMSDIQEDFRGTVWGKWVENHNLHFTFKFLGDTDTAIIPNIIESLDSELVIHKARIEFCGLGAFPNLNNPRVLFVNMKTGNTLLSDLFKSIDQKLYKLGIPKESKAFKPHLTLLRIKDINSADFAEKIKIYEKESFGIMDSFKIDLIESKLTKSGPIYTILK